MLTPQLLQAFFNQQLADYQKAYDSHVPYWNKFAGLVPSTTETMIHSWIAQLPKMVEWIGEKKVNQLRARGYAVTNKPFENTYEVDRDKLDDDQMGIYANHPSMQAEVAARWPEDLVTTALIAGITTVGFDGQPFFNTSHPIDVDNPSLGTYSNLLASTPFSAVAYATAKAAMRSFRGESGISLQVLPTITMVGPADEKLAKDVLQATNIANAAGTAAPSNVWQGDTTLIVNERLVDDEAGAWYMFSTNRMTPFIFQQRKAPTRVQMVDPSSPLVYNQAKFSFSVEARGASAPTLPFLAIKGRTGA